MNHPSRRKYLLLIPLVVLAVAAVFTFGVYALWNHVLVAVLGVKVITFWQALGLLVLARILFGGFPGRRRGPFGPFWRRRWMMKRWQSMTPEQREHWRAEMRARFGAWPRPPWCDDTPAGGETPGGTAPA